MSAFRQPLKLRCDSEWGIRVQFLVGRCPVLFEALAAMACSLLDLLLGHVPVKSGRSYSIAMSIGGSRGCHSSRMILWELVFIIYYIRYQPERFPASSDVRLVVMPRWIAKIGGCPSAFPASTVSSTPSLRSDCPPFHPTPAPPLSAA